MDKNFKYDHSSESHCATHFCGVLNIFQIFEKFIEFVLSPAWKTETYIAGAPRCKLLYGS